MRTYTITYRPFRLLRREAVEVFHHFGAANAFCARLPWWSKVIDKRIDGEMSDEQRVRLADAV